MASRSVFFIGGLALLAAACGLVSGVSDYAIVDEPSLPPACSGGGCVDGGVAPKSPVEEVDASADATVPPPNECDPAKDGNCIEVPEGWSLVALADFVDAAPACPAGFGGAKTVGTNPASVLANGCACSTCNVTQQAKCPRVLLNYGPGSNCALTAAPDFYMSDPPACKNTNYMTPYTDFHRWRFDAPEGGACTANAPTKNLDAVVWNGPKNRMCTSTSGNGCTGGRCKVSLVPPYRVCVAGGAGECPSTFPIKSTLGSPDFDCGGACNCTVNRSACTGKMFLYSDTACLQNEKEVPVDNICAQHAGVGGNAWPSFKTTATTQTTCTSTGNPQATNVRLIDPQTVCCR